jgi:DNA-binding transcriptional ArsR family regulator
MLHYADGLDRIFAALADPSRRAVVARLALGPATVSDLAKPLPMTLSAVVQHLKYLEESGIVRSTKVGRVRTCRLESRSLRDAESWLAGRRRRIEQRLDRLERHLAHDEEKP